MTKLPNEGMADPDDARGFFNLAIWSFSHLAIWLYAHAHSHTLQYTGSPIMMLNGKVSVSAIGT